MPQARKHGTPRTKSERRTSACLAFLGAALAALSGTSWAVDLAPPLGNYLSCAVLSRFGGQVQLLDPSRNHLVDMVSNAGVPCDGWVSVGSGWISLKHRNGFQIHAGPGSFFQIAESDREGKKEGDHLVLYKGQIYVRAGAGSGELRVLSSNARVRMRRGAGIVTFNQDQEDTQLVCLEDSASIENRFEPSRKIWVKEGEGSSLNFKALRVVPSTARAVSVASVRQSLAELHLNELQRAKAIRAVRTRTNRKFASVIGEPNDRKPASAFSAYARHAPSEEDKNLRDHWTKKIMGGQEVGDRILFPDKYYGRPQEVKVEVHDPLAEANQRRRRDEDREKARLIEELSQIRPE